MFRVSLMFPANLLSWVCRVYGMQASRRSARMAVDAAVRRCPLYGHRHHLKPRQNRSQDAPQTHPDGFHSAGHYGRQPVMQALTCWQVYRLMLPTPLMRLAHRLRVVRSALKTALLCHPPESSP